MDLRDYLRVLRKGWAVILAFVVLGLAAGIGLTLATTKVYEATAQVFVATSQSSSSTTDLANGNTFATDQVQSYVAFANGPAVVSGVIKDLNLNSAEAPSLANKITADAPLNKVLVNLHVTDHDPVTAAKLANSVADQFGKVVEQTAPQSGSNSVVKVTPVHAATVPSTPVSPHKALNIGLGFVLGLIIGVGVVVLRDVLDNTVKDTSEFDEAGVPAMGIVPLDKRTQSSPVAFRSDPNSARSEAYRQIRTNLQFVDVDNPPHIISVTSALPGEGKSTTALNLAAALAEAGSRVCLVEADLRRPSLARALGLIGEVGFTTALIGKTPVEDVLQNAGQNLAVLTSGPIPPNPSELLITDHARALIQQVASHVDFVVIDTPPLLPVTDGATVATLADATLLVCRTGKTTREQAARSIDSLDKVGRRPVGVVFNMVTRGRGGYSYEYGYYYTSAEKPKKMGRGAVGVSAGQSAPDEPTTAQDESLEVLDTPLPRDADKPGARPAARGEAGPDRPSPRPPAVPVPAVGATPAAEVQPADVPAVDATAVDATAPDATALEPADVPSENASPTAADGDDPDHGARHHLPGAEAVPAWEGTSATSQYSEATRRATLGADLPEAEAPEPLDEPVAFTVPSGWSDTAPAEDDAPAGEVARADDPLAVSWPRWSASDEPTPPRDDDTDTQTIPIFDGPDFGRHDFSTPIATQTSLDLGAPVAADSAPTVDDLHADFSARSTRPWTPEEQQPVEPATSRVPWYAESDERPSWTPNGYGH